MAKTQIKEGEAQLYDRIFDDITTGVLAPGSRLKVADLAVAYGTSTTPIREVLRQLQGQGILRIEPNRGAIVPKIDADTIRDIFECLNLLEPYFVSWFAETAEAAQIDALNAIQDEIEAVSIKDRIAFTKLDSKFHQLIASQHYNQRAVATWTNHRKALQAFSCQIPISSNRYKHIFREHRALIEAFSRNDIAQALEIASKHAAGAGDNMHRQLRSAAETMPARA